jgi:hypothetical protein
MRANQIGPNHIEARPLLKRIRRRAADVLRVTAAGSR